MEINSETKLDYLFLLLSHLGKTVYLQKEKEKLLDDFLSSITHEVRTPLALIRGFAQVLLEDDDLYEKNKKDFIRTIYKESVKLSNMLDKLSFLSKLDRGKLLLNKSLVEPERFIKEIIENFYSSADERGVSLTVSSKGEIPSISLDTEKMRMVFQEFFRDALKVTGRNGKIEIILTSTDKNLKIELKDNGKGIPAEELPFIFDKFYKVSSLDNEEGTGLGLVLAKRIIEEHEGSLTVKSQEMKGTSFFIFLPLYW